MGINQLVEPDMDDFYSNLDQPKAIGDKIKLLVRGHTDIKITDTNKKSPPQSGGVLKISP